MPTDKSYTLKLTPRFIADTMEAVQYISAELHNATAAENLSEKTARLLQKRLSYPTAFERYFPYEGSPAYYRIYVDNYVIFYVVSGDIMEARRLLHKSMNAASQLD